MHWHVCQVKSTSNIVAWNSAFTSFGTANASLQFNIYIFKSSPRATLKESFSLIKLLVTNYHKSVCPTLVTLILFYQSYLSTEMREFCQKYLYILAKSNIDVRVICEITVIVVVSCLILYISSIVLCLTCCNVCLCHYYIANINI